MEVFLLENKHILLFFAVSIFFLTSVGFAQGMDENLLEKLKKENIPTEKEKVKEKMLPEVMEAGSLSTIEKMFKNQYFITRERRELEKVRDSLATQVKSESLRIELMGEYTTADTLYYQHLSKLSTIEKQLDPISVTLRQYGYNIFQTTLPEMPSFTPVAEEYILGPGDELIIDVTGELNNSWNKIINRDGKIVLPKAGEINLWGRTYKEAKKRIQQVLNKKFSNIEVSVSLGGLKSVNVFILGEVRNPGVHNITVLSNPLSGLYNAGGPTRSGSLRRIRYIPNKGTGKNFDLYNLLIKGNRLPNIHLESGDIIYVPTIGKVIGVSGAVTRPGIYEIEGSEDLSDILEMAGGILPTAGRKRVQMERISSGNKKVVKDFRFEDEKEFRRTQKNIKIKSGDLVSVFEMPPLRHNYVEIRGNVERPGTYGLEKGMNVLDLINEAGSLKEGTFLDRAEILRFTGVENPEIIEFDLGRLLDNDSLENLKLKEWDKVRIFTLDEIAEKDSIKIMGEVLNPGTYSLNPNMTVEDLIFTGIPKRSARSQAELFRIDPDKGTSLKKIDLGDSTALKIKLQPKDQILIKRKTAYREIGSVYLGGEFTYPGIYPIKVGVTLNKIIERAGSFTTEAYLEGTIFTRKSVAELQNKAIRDLIRETSLRLIEAQRKIMEGEMSSEEKATQMEYIKTQQLQLSKLSYTWSPGRVVIDLNDPEQLNMPLEDGDSLYVPKLPKTVQIIGQVFNPIGITYEEGLTLKDYLKMAGGSKPTADKKEIYVRRASGKVVKDPDKIKPGDTIVVPEKVEIGKSFWEIASTSATILYQIGIAIVALHSILK
ncbi:MAG: SLBB domain-containing protein [candidate division WOR-3 bacterium]|nr:SLBB domain-containing protein [candidate division WOR-3 bacterium]